MNDELQFYVPQVYFEQIPIKNLVSNQEYQRNISIAHIQKTAENFDLYQINPVKVSRRGEINFVFDGQHTIEVVALVSGSRDTPIWCMIYDDLHYEYEANIFANQQKHNRPLTPYEIFMAHIEAGNNTQLVIKSLVESYGLTISSNKSVGSITAISTMVMLYEKYGYNNLDKVLRIAIGTWEGDSNAFSASILKGIAILVATYGEALREEMFKEKLGRVPINEIARTARERNYGAISYAEALLFFYNKKLKYPLSYRKLHGNNTRQSISLLIEEQLSLLNNEILDDEVFQNE